MEVKEMSVKERNLIDSVFGQRFLLVRGFSPKLGFLAVFFYISSISPGGNYCIYWGQENREPFFYNVKMAKAGAAE
jgi:hypothetical protein